MKLTFFGHACFELRSENDFCLVTDPYEPGGYQGKLAYSPVDAQPDVITVSHEHPDHAYIQQFAGNPTVIAAPGEFSADNARILGISTFHDSERGRIRGGNIVFLIEMDGLRLAHMGDLGSILGPADIETLTPLDVLMLPVGGTFTIDWRQAGAQMAALKPKITIPMHYRTDKCSFDIDLVDSFLVGKDRVMRTGTSTIDVKEYVEDHPGSIVVLDHAR